MKFAMVSGAEFQGKITTFAGNVFDWAALFEGTHYPATLINKDKSILNEYDVVLLVDADRYLETAAVIARECKCKTIFYPEATIEAYCRFVFDHQRLVYELLDAVDLIGAVEENRIQWYESLWGQKAFFMHIPTPEIIINGSLRRSKTRELLVCCNLGMDELRYRTNLISSLAVVKQVGKPCTLCEVQQNQLWFYVERMGVEQLSFTSRLRPRDYMTGLVAPSRVMLTPSAIIGTSRNAIVGAGCGTPVIGNRDSHTQMRLWPKLATYIYDVKTMTDLVNRLYGDEKFYQEVCDYAFEQLSYYSTENAKRRFLEAVESV